MGPKTHKKNTHNVFPSSSVTEHREVLALCHAADAVYQHSTRGKASARDMEGQTKTEGCHDESLQLQPEGLVNGNTTDRRTFFVDFPIGPTAFAQKPFGMGFWKVLWTPNHSALRVVGTSYAKFGISLLISIGRPPSIKVILGCNIEPSKPLQNMLPNPTSPPPSCTSPLHSALTRTQSPAASW